MAGAAGADARGGPDAVRPSIDAPCRLGPRARASFPQGMPVGPALGVDIGGTKLAAACVGPDGAIRCARRVPTDVGADAESLFGELAALVHAVLDEANIDAAKGGTAGISGPAEAPAPVVCGVGSGGPMLPGGETVSPLNIPAWRGFPLRERMEEVTGLATYIDNDAKALALAEGWRGAAASQRDYMAMVVSTGIGGGIVVDGRLVDGSSGNAGHVGHVTVEPGGRPCRCGARGCLEAEASGSAILEMTGRPAEEATAGVIERTGTLVGRAVAMAAHLLDIRIAVVAGSVALGFGAPFFEAAQAEIDARARLEFARGVRIVPAGLGANGPIVGAAAVGWRGLGTWPPTPAAFCAQRRGDARRSP